MSQTITGADEKSLAAAQFIQASTLSWATGADCGSLLQTLWSQGANESVQLVTGACQFFRT